MGEGLGFGAEKGLGFGSGKGFGVAAGEALGFGAGEVIPPPIIDEIGGGITSKSDDILVVSVVSEISFTFSKVELYVLLFVI